MFSNVAFVDKIKIGVARKYIVEETERFTRCAFLQKFLSLGPPVKHVLCCLRVFPASLDLGTNRKRCKDLPRDFPLTIGLLKILLFVAGLSTLQTILQVRIWPGEPDTRPYAHVVLPGD